MLQHEIPPPQLLAWNASQPMLGVGHSSSGAVLLYNCASAATAGSSAPSSIQRPQHVLVHQLQQQVSSVAWRPVHSSMLAVGCTGGVAMWNLGKLPLSTAAMSRGSDGATNAAAAWTTFLSFRANCRCGVLQNGTAQATVTIACLVCKEVSSCAGCAQHSTGRGHRSACSSSLFSHKLASSSAACVMRCAISPKPCHVCPNSC